MDTDREAVEFAQRRLYSYSNITIFQANFKDLDKILNRADISLVDGVLLDLGVSSHQIDRPERGFSYLSGETLDMRMNTMSKKTAADIINHLDAAELSDIFHRFGEERNARKIARTIVNERKNAPITQTDQLRRIIDRYAHPRYAIKSYARIFQALRIAVNNELENLSGALDLAVRYVHSGGRIVVIAYHSLEDRIVKNFFREQSNPCICPPELPECVCGRTAKMKPVTRKVLHASDEEVRKNPRARSALLRAGEIL
jgi:16S rRNA (cytosine1402-N4)-methyltransferase